MGHLSGTLHTNKQTRTTDTHTFISCLQMGELHNAHFAVCSTLTTRHIQMHNRSTCACLAEKWVILTRHAPSKDGTCLWYAAHKQTNPQQIHTHSSHAYRWVNFTTRTQTKHGRICVPHLCGTLHLASTKRRITNPAHPQHNSKSVL